jgi:two-component system C4-dicarboxylate transport sensor histidine kinase DctB
MIEDFKITKRYGQERVMPREAKSVSRSGNRVDRKGWRSLPRYSFHYSRIWLRFGLRLLAVPFVCVLSGWGMYDVFLTRQLDRLAHQSQNRVEFYRMSLESLLVRNESLPSVAAMESPLYELMDDPANEQKRAVANEYLLEVKKHAGLTAAFLMDKNGLTLASSNYQLPWSFVSHNYAFRPYFQEAMAGNLGIFYGVGMTVGEPGYLLASPIVGKKGTDILGVVAILVSLREFEAALTRSDEPVLLVDANGVVFLASVPELKYRTLAPLDNEARKQIDQSRQYGWYSLRPLGMGLRLQNDLQQFRAQLPGSPAAEDYLAQSTRVGRLGWSLFLLTRTRQERQSALLAGVAAGLTVAVLLSLATFFQLSVKRYNERRQTSAMLRRAHAGLKKRIAEKTADLTATNAALEEKIVALKTTETVLRETRDSAVQAGKLAVLGQMAASIGHEVNQPLTALHAFTDNAVDLLERGNLDEVRENLGLIRQMAERIASIVGEIKNFSRRPPTERSAIEVAGTVDQMLMLVETRRKRIGARIDTCGIPGDLHVLADAQRLEQVLVNLLLNALDAISESVSRWIMIGAERDGRWVRIVFRDSGPGIPEAVLPHLFEPFFTTKEAGHGLGLGLPISRMIAVELGGSIEARNLDEGGAEFTVILEGTSEGK